MAKSIHDKLEQKRAALVERTARALGIDEAEAIRLLSIGRVQSVRINMLKAHTHVVEELMAMGWYGKRYEWFQDGYSIESGLHEIRDSELASTGQVYIQNAASWLPVLALDVQPNETVLDVCAAPGGKTSHIAAYSHNRAYITANDNSRARLAKLRSNLERLGAQNVEYTLYDATQIARKLDGQQFDKILLDAPCSGEGMMNYGSDRDMSTWSVAHIKRLRQLQKRILAQAWQLLKPGGILVYSTCTMAPEEDEAVIDYHLRSRDDAEVLPCTFELENRVATVREWNGRQYGESLQNAVRLVPSHEAEAFFVCRLQKTL